MATVMKKFIKGIRLKPDNTTIPSIEGSLKVDLATSTFKAYLGGASRDVVTTNQTQTLTNKTFDANGTGNVLSNVETADLASGVLNTSTSLAAASNTQVPSALAVKTYVDNSAGDVQTDVNDLVTLSGVPVNSTNLGTFTGTTIPDNQTEKQAFQALETASELNATNLTAHINDTTDAHAASAITNTPSGNLAATTIQGAVNELQGDIDTINTTSLPAKVTGSASATDEAVARFDGTTGKLVQNSVVTITDAGIAAGFTGLTSSGTVSSTGTLAASGSITEALSTDSATTGANATLTSPTTPFVRLTNASLTSIDTIASPVAGRVLTIENFTGNTITFNNDTGGTAANRIYTGTKAALSVADQASIIVKYDSTNSRWMVIGGSGSGSGQSLATVFQLTGTDVPTWSTGDNATFLGGGTISGTFTADTSTPLHGTSSYKYTQAAGSLDDYFASAAQTVDPRFRGVPVTLYFPYTYNGSNNDIQVYLYDVTNAAIIPDSAFIQATSGVTIFKTNVTIPTTCTSIRVGFQTKVLNSGKIFAFDDIQLSSDTTLFAANISQQSTYVTNGTTFGVATITGALTSSVNLNTVFTYNSSTGAYTATKQGVFNASLAVQVLTARAQPAIYVDGVVMARTNSENATGVLTTISWSGVLNAGQVLTFRNEANSINSTFASLSAEATNSAIVQQTDTFSSDTATLTYASSSTFTVTTLPNAPVGTFITYTYAINTNTLTQTTTAPTQTTADMNANGILLYTRAFNAASTSAQPARLAIQIGKGLKGVTKNLYASTGKVLSGTLDSYPNGAFTQEIGARFQDYNESTGILTLDAGFRNGATTSSIFVFNDGTQQSSGYVTISGSKNPALTGLNITTIAASVLASSGQSIPNNTNTIITFNSTKIFDTHGAYTTGANGFFTAPETGYYQANLTVAWASNSFTAGNSLVIFFYKNGSQYSRATLNIQSTLSFQPNHQFSDVVYLAKGDTLDPRIFQNSGGARSLDTSDTYFTIAKINVG